MQHTQQNNQPDETTDIDSVDKIRDILFGHQMRDFERKFEQLEQRLNNEIEHLRAENTQQIASLHTTLNNDMDSLSSQLNTEEQNRMRDLDTLGATFNKQTQQMNKQISNLSHLLDTHTQETKQQNQKLTAEINQQLDRLKQRIDDFKHDLNTGKVDKSTLADMFQSFAVGINNEQ